MQLSNGIITYKGSKVVYVFRHDVPWSFVLGDLLA